MLSRRQQLLASLAPLALASTLAQAAPGPFPEVNQRLVSVSIEDAINRQPLDLYGPHNGRSFVIGTPQRPYHILVRNNTREDLLVVPSVDGVNTLTGKTAAPDQSGYIVPALGSVRIDGWRKSLDEVAQFYFTAQENSYAGRTGRPANIGVIGLAVFEKAVPRISKDRYLGWPTPPTMPAAPYSMAPTAPPLANEAPMARAEALGKSRSAEADIAGQAPRLGTGHGQRQASSVTWTDFVRRTSYPSEVVAIEYDSLGNLRDRGVVPTRVHIPRSPNPFPAGGFVPDPPAR